MDWFGTGGNGPLIAVRAIHFAATALMAGSLVFRSLVMKPVSRFDPAAARSVGTQTLHLAWIGLAITLLSGAIWLLLQAVSMSGLPFAEAMTPDVLSTVLSQTQFGMVADIRFALAIVLAACLACHRSALADAFALAAALGVSAAIAWTGHAGATLGEGGNLHLVADTMHLVAASAWIGGLVPLVLLLAAAGRRPEVASAALAHAAAQRFSTPGFWSARFTRSSSPDMDGC